MDEITPRDADFGTMQQNKLAQVGEPETGILAQIDLSMLQIIQKLFTGPGNGPAFLARILRFAEVKQMALPGVEETADVAVITLQTIRELAQKIQWGYDTTHKYVVVFCALNLLVKVRCEGRIQLLFSLKQYTPPPTFKALDSLINKSRPKVRQFAMRVKRRCILYNIIQREETKQEGHSTLEQQLLQQLQSILQAEHIDQTQRQRLMMRISSEIFSKLIVPSNTVESLPPSGSSSSEQKKTPDKVSPHIVDSLAPCLINGEKTSTHESTTTQADIVTSGRLLAPEEKTRTLPAPSPELDSSSGKEIKPPERETFRRESPPAQTNMSDQGRLSDQGKTYETASSESGRHESTAANNQAFLKALLGEQLSSPTSLRSRQKQQPTQIGKILSQESTMKRGDSPTPSDPERKIAEIAQASKGDSRNLRIDEATTKSLEGDLQPPQEASLLQANKYGEDSQNVEVDSQVSKQLSEQTETSVIKSPTEEKSSEQLAGAGDFSRERVDFSTITQINIVNYSESFLHAYVTLNVIGFINKTYNKDVNVTSRTELAKFLAEVMDNDSEKWKIHMKLLNNCHPDVIAGAFIHIFSKLYDRGGESIRNKAGLFTQYCKDFQANTVPAGTVLLANSLKHLTFEQMIAFFKDRQQKVEPHQSTPSEQTQQQATSNSVYALEVPKERGTILVKQGNKVVARKFNFGGFTSQKRRIAKGF